MDMMYMTDVLAYQTIRGPIYEKYAWDQQNKIGQTKKQNTEKKNKEKEPCKICQERQRRSLMKYIRSKSHEHSDQDIKEEEEEEVQTKTEQEESTKC